MHRGTACDEETPKSPLKYSHILLICFPHNDVVRNRITVWNMFMDNFLEDARKVQDSDPRAKGSHPKTGMWLG